MQILAATRMRTLMMLIQQQHNHDLAGLFFVLAVVSLQDLEPCCMSI